MVYNVITVIPLTATYKMCVCLKISKHKLLSDNWSAKNYVHTYFRTHTLVKLQMHFYGLFEL